MEEPNNAALRQQVIAVSLYVTSIFLGYISFVYQEAAQIEGIRLRGLQGSSKILWLVCL